MHKIQQKILSATKNEFFNKAWIVCLVGNSGHVPSAANRIFTSAFLLKFLGCLSLKIEMGFTKINNQTFTRTKRIKKSGFFPSAPEKVSYIFHYVSIFFQYFTILSIFFS